MNGGAPTESSDLKCTNWPRPEAWICLMMAGGRGGAVLDARDSGLCAGTVHRGNSWGKVGTRHVRRADLRAVHKGSAWIESDLERGRHRGWATASDLGRDEAELLLHIPNQSSHLSRAK